MLIPLQKNQKRQYKYVVKECIPMKKRDGSTYLTGWWAIGKYMTLRQALQALRDYRLKPWRVKFGDDDWRTYQHRIEHVYYF
jgi:hypothetical protein